MKGYFVVVLSRLDLEEFLQLSVSGMMGEGSLQRCIDGEGLLQPFVAGVAGYFSVLLTGEGSLLCPVSAGWVKGYFYVLLGEGLPQRCVAG